MDHNLESSLKISNIQSLKDVKREKESMEEPTIKIRSISEINQSKGVLISKQHPSQQQFLSKNIVVRKVPNVNQRISIQQRISSINGSPKMIKIPQQEVIDSPVKPTINFPVPPALDAYIKELEEQNREMKKLLLECRRETVSIQMRTHKLTNIINTTIAKYNNIKRPVLKQPPQLQQPSTIPQSPHHSQPQLIHPPIMQKRTLKVVPKKSNNITAKGNIVCRVPVFPITRMQILKQLEIDLSKKEFSEYVFQKLYTTNNKAEIDKPSVLLNNTLNSIIDPKLMGMFQYDEDSSSEAKEFNDSEYFRSLQRIRVLYGKLVNALSNTIFTKSVDMVALEKFVKNKISTHRSEFLQKCERLKASKSPELKEPQMTIKTEKDDADDKCINIDENHTSWMNMEEPMNTDES